MSDGAICRCIHGCRQYAVKNDACPSCLAGWHSDVCAAFQSERLSYRLNYVPLVVGETTYCGTCGAQPAQHRVARPDPAPPEPPTDQVAADLLDPE